MTSRDDTAFVTPKVETAVEQKKTATGIKESVDLEAVEGEEDVLQDHDPTTTQTQGKKRRGRPKKQEQVAGLEEATEPTVHDASVDLSLIHI